MHALVEMPVKHEGVGHLAILDQQGYAEHQDDGGQDCLLPAMELRHRGHTAECALDAILIY